MIGWLKGVLLSQEGSHLLIDTGGIGYEVQVPETFLGSIGPIGSTIELFIHTHVREDAMLLYGFATKRDRALFNTLTSVSGIGPKTGMGIMAAISSERLIDAIRSGNTAQLHSLPGIGKKTAERLVLELKDKLKNFSIGSDGKTPKASGLHSLSEEVISALVNLGYKRPSAEEAVSRMDLSEAPSFDRILKETLKLLAK